MKGHCNIQVFDKNGLLKKEIKKDNLITNAIDTIINPPFPAYFECNNDTKVQPLKAYAPIVNNLLGGILLFNATRDEDVSHIMPTPQDLESYVGSAGGSFTGFANTSKIKGTLNLNETTKLDNGYKYVWDFPTGKSFSFRSLSLTSQNGGNVGLSWDSNDTISKGEVFGKYNQKLDGNANSLAVRQTNNLTNVPLASNTDGDICYVSNDFKTLVLGKLTNNAYTLSKYHFRDGIKITDTFTSSTNIMSDYTNWEKDLIYSITPTSAILDDTYRIIWEGDYIYSISPAYSSSTKILTINYVKINAITMTIEVENVFTIENIDKFSASNRSYVICNNKLYLNDGENDRVYIINLDTYTLENTMTYTTLNTSAMHLIKFNDDLIALMMTGSSSSYMYMIDLVNMKMYLQKLSGASFSSVDGIHQKCLKQVGNSPVFIGKSSNDIDYLNANIYECFIASVLNLNEEITKNEDEVLKITYTILNN